MGYLTELFGEFRVSPPLAQKHADYLLEFNKTRRMMRSPEALGNSPDPCREAVGLPLGNEGSYFTGGDTPCLDYNSPPEEQPSLWCPWKPAQSLDALEWDGLEKPGSETEWVSYLVKHFLGPWGYTLSGEVTWQGEEDEDRGTIFVKGNQVEAVLDSPERGRPSWEQ